VVSARRKTWLITRALLTRVTMSRPPRATAGAREPEMVEAIRYLVELAVEPAQPAAFAAPDSFYERTVWVIELCERLRARERLDVGAAKS
jgi:hypothetical protein